MTFWSSGKASGRGGNVTVGLPVTRSIPCTFSGSPIARRTARPATQRPHQNGFHRRKSQEMGQDLLPPFQSQTRTFPENHSVLSIVTSRFSSGVNASEATKLLGVLMEDWQPAVAFARQRQRQGCCHHESCPRRGIFQCAKSTVVSSIDLLQMRVEIFRGVHI